MCEMLLPLDQKMKQKKNECKMMLLQSYIDDAELHQMF